MYWVESAGVFALKAWSMLTPKTTDTNADAIIAPKGNGALLAQAPDGTVAGGNARGIYSVDLQMVRGAATNVASGTHSIVMGEGNTASGNYSVSLGGTSSLASGVQSVTIGGWANSASAAYAFAGFGYQNVASGEGAIAMGRQNTASGLRAMAVNRGNTAGAIDSFVAGQNNNVVNGGSYSSITGGANNLINTAGVNSSYCHIGGGGSNQLNNVQMSVIAGGTGNIMNAGGQSSFIGGGVSNTLSGNTAGILCGAYNSITGNYSVICGGGTGTAGQGNTISGIRGFIGNGSENSVGGTYNSVINGSKVTVSGDRNTVLGSRGFTTFHTCTITGSDNLVQSLSGKTLISGTGNVVLGYNGSAGAAKDNTGFGNTIISCSDMTISGSTQSLFAASTYSNSVGDSLAWQIGSVNCTSGHEQAGVIGGNGVSVRTHHSCASGYSVAQRHCADFAYRGAVSAGATVSAIATTDIMSTSVAKDTRTVLTIPANSIMVGKLNISVKETTSLAVTAWIDAQVVIAKGTSTPTITINKVDTIMGISGVSIAIVNSSTVTDGIEFQITSVSAKTLRAKATFEYDVIID